LQNLNKTREFGFVCSSADDWSMGQVALPMSLLFCLHGLSAAAFGKWQMKVGPRTSINLAGLCFGGGLALSGLGTYMHNLPLIYLGFGIFSGTGLGLAYTPPIQALIEWFPDKKGVASGLTIMGFGSGALFFVPATNYLSQKFSKLPLYLGDAVTTTLKDGRLFAEVDGTSSEVVYATASDLAKIGYSSLSEGYYLVGSGSTGAAATLATMGAVYCAILMTSAMTLKRPHPDYSPPGYVAPVVAGGGGAFNVHVDEVMKTPQFYCLATTLFCLASGGMGLISVCKPLMTETFGSLLPTIVTASFASTYIMIISLGNLGGRIGWGVMSDFTGRPFVFNMFTLGSAGLYLSFPWLVKYVVDTRDAMPLALFCGSTALAISFMGGCYAILPAYESDLFGTKYVGANHGRMLLASSAAAVVGPSLIIALRNMGEKSSIMDLLKHVDPVRFQQKFGIDISHVDELVATKTVTISKLMDLVPATVPDPTPFMYNTSFYAMAGLMAVAAAAHLAVRPVDPKFYEKIEGQVLSSKPVNPASDNKSKDL
jgi:MFS family permease